jgi:hypothetical protein
LALPILKERRQAEGKKISGPGIAPSDRETVTLDSESEI